MDKFDRIFHLHKILASRRTAIPPEDLMAKLECSKSTLHRIINALKDYLNAPIIFDANAGGYRYAKESQGESYELPGLWFTPASNRRAGWPMKNGIQNKRGSGCLTADMN